MSAMADPSPGNVQSRRLLTPRNSCTFEKATFNQLSGEDAGKSTQSASDKPSNGYPGKSNRASSTSHGRGTDYRVAVNLPNGDKAKLFGRAGMSVESLIQPLVQELQWREYRVVLSSTRQEVHLEESSAVLDDKEIDIEDTAVMRKKVAMEILESEKIYCSSLTMVIYTYAVPLKAWKLHKVSQDILFHGIYNLKQLSESLIEELQDAIAHWNDEKTCIGCILNRQPNFPGVFEDYSYSYTKAARLLREKRATQHDNGFTAFILAQKGHSVHSLDSLLLVPNQRIQTYGKLLSQLVYATPGTHHDHSELRKVTSAVAQLLDRRTEAITNAENQAKLEYMQLRFSQQLHLNRPISYLFQPVKRKKITSTSNITSPTPDFLSSCGDVQLPDSRPSKAAPKAETLSTRRYIQEGPVQLTMLSKSATKERYLFLLSDVVITAKRKATATTSSNSFHLKERQRVRDLWISQCPDDLQTELSEFGLEPHCSFLIGWPLCNHVATFSTPQEKEMWYLLMKKQIEECPLEDSHRPTVTILVVNKATTISSSYAPKKYMDVSLEQSSKDVVAMALDLWKIEDAPERYCLWVNSSKEDSSAPLLGHERPYSIKLYMNTRHLDSNSALIDEISQAPATVAVHFVLKMAQSNVPYFSGEKQQPRTKRVRTTLGKSVSTTFVNKFFRGNRSKESTGTGIDQVTMTFGQQLDKVICPDLPAWLQIALVRLYMEGPETNGILRKSASARQVRLLKEVIDAGDDPDFSGVHVLAIGALIKEFLRGVPGYILNGDLYTEWVACLDKPGDEAKIKQVRRMLERLPNANQVLLYNFFVILAKIADNHLVNQMHSENVAICVSPSLLSPADDMQVLKNEVPPLIQFILNNIGAIFEGQGVPAVVELADAISERNRLESMDSPEMSPTHHTASDPNLQSTGLSSSTDDLVNDMTRLTINHNPSLSNSTPILYTGDDGDTGYRSVQTAGEASDSMNGRASSTANDFSSEMTSTPSPQLPRGTAHIPGSYAQDVRASAQSWRQSDKAVVGGGAGSPGGSRLVVYRHRQAQQRALEAQQAAPSISLNDTSGSHQSARTKLHSSASQFVDQLAKGRSPAMNPRNATADLDSEAAAETQSLQELYELFNVKTHGKQQKKRPSISLPPSGFISASTPATPAQNTPQKTLQGASASVTQSERIRRHLGRHWYSQDDTLTTEDPMVYSTSSPSSTSQFQSQASPPTRPMARVAKGEKALITALSQQLELNSRSTQPAASEPSRRQTLRTQAQSLDDSSSDDSSNESDDEQVTGQFLRPQEKYFQQQQQQQTRSLGKVRSTSNTRAPDGLISATMYNRRLSIPNQPSRVTTKSFELPTPRQPVFEDVKYDEESYV